MRSGKDCYITITESRRVEGDKLEKTKIFLFREDFEKFMYFLDGTISWVNENFAEGKKIVPQEEKSVEAIAEPSA
jgi:hypothetical protein